jgi:hypothetical protein
MEWGELLEFAAHDGVAVIVGALLAVLAEYWTWYQNRGPVDKRAIFFSLSLAVPVVASVLGVVTAEWPATWSATFWPAVRAGLMAAGVGTAVHTRWLKRVNE